MFANIRVGTRLVLGFSLVLGLLLMIAAIGAWRLSAVDQMVAGMVDQTMRKERLIADWAANTHLNGARTILVAESSDPQRQKQIQAAIKETSAEISQIQKALEASDLSPAEQALMAEIGERRKTYLAARTAVFQAKESSMEEAARLVQSALEPALQVYVGSIRKGRELEAAAITAAAATVKDEAAASRRRLAMLGGMAILLGIAVCVLVTRAIRRQLGGEPAEAVSIARRIAAGDLSQAVRASADGSVLAAMGRMQEQLTGMVGKVRSGTEAIATASSQIASGNQGLSARAGEQASALQQTAASMEELTATVQQNADNARQANGLALSASEVAARGGEVVARVVATMASINESSKRIADIIGVIDGIAFQTNILALNAAVEAARAGEQGRGFAVVASEVRNLAQRSAQAAREIKELIGASVQKVDLGAELVGQAGTTIDEVIGSVRRVTDIMGEISAASAEQSAGIGQVNQAVAKMEQVTQQNADLMEQAAVAADSLQRQAVVLAEVVEAFRLQRDRY